MTVPPVGYRQVRVVTEPPNHRFRVRVRAARVGWTRVGPLWLLHESCQSLVSVRTAAECTTDVQHGMHRGPAPVAVLTTLGT